MARFKKGQHVVCIDKRPWIKADTYVLGVGPAYNDIVTCAGYKPNKPHMMYLEEWDIYTSTKKRYCYDEQFFAPLITDSELEEELKQIEVRV